MGLKKFLRRLLPSKWSSKTGAGRPTDSSPVSLPTQTSTLPRSALLDDNTQCPVTSGSTTSTSTPKDGIFDNAPEEVSSDEEAFRDAPENFEDIKPQASPTSPSTAQVQADSAQSTGSVPASAPRSPQKKALLTGLNYKQCDKEKRLRHATSDAQRFATALTKLGYSSENTRVVTDEDQASASREYLLECMDWLVSGASEGDRLFFMFSGHCLFPHGEKEPYLLAADMEPISRSTFHERLISKVPAGAELNVVLDCCHAAGMVQLKYRVGQMVPELAASPIRSVPHYGSLHGLDGPRGPALSVQTTPVMINRTPVGTPTNTVPRRGARGGIAAAQPLASAPVASSTEATGFSPAAGKQLDPAQRRRPVVQGPPLVQFQERKNGFVTPAGKVIVWAGTGERLKAFEASGGVESGIVTSAFCGALECHDSPVTRGALWKSLVGVISEENRCRRERDAKKPNSHNIPPNTRLQLAELWVSQDEPLSSPSPILNQAVDCPWKPYEATA
ncbi:unnamed protein product [Rhizoctonia solani]|uniref:Peptidase C14 caspase domain-containing protein n=1 Tax=Rhizoctonia solani TaxID=456999 RepID=A0A8H3GWZ2_9AGAM|nr:unnamed protein product [Rhizoctonia solani]